MASTDPEYLAWNELEASDQDYAIRKDVIESAKKEGTDEMIRVIAKYWTVPSNWRERKDLGTFAYQMVDCAEVISEWNEYDFWQVAEALINLSRLSVQFNIRLKDAIEKIHENGKKIEEG